MSNDVRARFKTLGNFPSPPGIAQEIIALAKDPEADIAAVTRAIGKDPALATKVLRTANSPLYAQRRRSENLRQALLVIGVEAVLTMCLSFSIAGTFRKAKSGSIDFARYWRRSLLAALGSRCAGEALGLPEADDLFLAGLLQDIGVVALDRAQPGFYAELPADASHADRCSYERARLGEDHAALGAWLLDSWHLPAALCEAVELSHGASKTANGGGESPFTRCVAFGGDLANYFLADDRQDGIVRICERAQQLLNLRQEQIGKIIERVTELTKEVGSLFETTLLSAEDAVTLMEEAQQLLAERNVEALQEISALQTERHSLEARSVQLEDATRRDALTGVHNRGHLDRTLQSEFDAARAGQWPLCALFVDLDHFKRINDTFGHAAGDAVLRAAADTMLKTVRDRDLVARYGGEEFVILLPGISPPDAKRLGERLLEKLRTQVHSFGGKTVVVTASLGLAIDTPARPFANAAALIAAADAAVYAAKHAGRDRLVINSDPATASLARAG